MYRAVAELIDLPILQVYTSISGIDTGYGFFAPNVASEYALEFNFYDQENNLLNIEMMPHFRQNESYHRYTSFLGAFQKKITAPKTKLDILRERQLDAIIKAMTKKKITEHKTARRIEATLYLYHPPTLRQFNTGHKDAQLLKIFQFELTSTN